MSRFKIGAIITVGVLVSFGFWSVGWGEDTIPPGFTIDCGGNCGDVLAKTRPNSILSAIPGGTFVITVAHIAPSPEDAVVRRRPVICDPVKVRIDTLRVKSGDGSIEVELGEQQSLAAGKAYRMMYNVDPQRGTGLPTYELDMMGFRFRSEPPSSRCNITASGLFYPDPYTTAPISFALIPSAERSPGNSNGRGR